MNFFQSIIFSYFICIEWAQEIPFLLMAVILLSVFYVPYILYILPYLSTQQISWKVGIIVIIMGV